LKKENRGERHPRNIDDLGRSAASPGVKKERMESKEDNEGAVSDKMRSDKEKKESKAELRKNPLVFRRGYTSPSRRKKMRGRKKRGHQNMVYK